MGDRFSLRLIISIGLVLNALTVILFATVGEEFGIYQFYWYLPLWILNGFVTSTNFPNLVALMGKWFGKAGRGFILGLWSTNSSVGNIVGSVLVGSLLNYGYDVAMLIPAILLIVQACFMFFGIVDEPSEVGLRYVGNDASDEKEPLLASDDNEETSLITSAMIIPNSVFDNDTSGAIKEANSFEQSGNAKNYGAATSQQKEEKKAISLIGAILLPGVIIVRIEI